MEMNKALTKNKNSIVKVTNSEEREEAFLIINPSQKALLDELERAGLISYYFVDYYKDVSKEGVNE